jgi:para-aminobenzoate synthetase component 1
MPIVREIPFAADDLLHALLNLDPARRVSILDSGGSRGEEARFLIAGFDPFEVVEAWGDRLFISGEGESVERMAGAQDALRVLDDRLERYRVTPQRAARLPAAGACVATFSYDLVRRIEHLRSRPHGAMSEPDAVLAFYDTLVIHDYARGATKIVSVAGPERLTKIYDAINVAANSLKAQAPGGAEADGQSSHQPRRPSPFDLRDTFSDTAFASNFTRDEYVEAVRRIKERIAAGDIYQANLTQQLSVTLDEDLEAEHIFSRLRRFHPASFAAFIRRRKDTVVSASPERFLRVEASGDAAKRERRVEAWPIKGTRRRGRIDEEDARLRAELLASEKDRAENVMIVDLLRNDLGRVCEYGSIEVPELCAIQEHPTLFHLVSKVRGRLRPEVTAGDLLRAAFPCGSVTGAPKIRAMEIIDEIETAPRGLSMGAIGYFSFDGALDMSVAIRTMTVMDGTSRFNVGGGIVADSDPVLEYEESLVKARALLRALGGRDDWEQRTG